MPTLLDRAREEFEGSRASQPPDQALLARRQAAEKAWGYVVEQLDRLLNVQAPDHTAHEERRSKLAELEARSGAPLLRAYYDLQRELHGDCFYRGSCPSERVERLLLAAEEYPGRVEAALRAARRRA